jgi:dephospho-CoA kinase
MARFLVAITGGVASGKSAAARAFESLGLAVADADVAARELVEPGQPALAEIAARFGPAVLQGDGRLDRPALRAKIFSDVAGKRDLEAILHPRIRSWLQARCGQAPGPYALAAIPLLVEGGSRRAYPWLDRILVVDVPASLQLARLQARDGVDAGLAGRMLAAQASREARLAAADDVIGNDGPISAMDAAVARLDALYRRLAASAN